MVSRSGRLSTGNRSVAFVEIAEAACSPLNRPYTSPSTNYLDFEREFRTDSTLHDTAGRLMSGLIDRELLDWLPVSYIWDDHQNGVDCNNELHSVYFLSYAANSLGELLRTVGFDVRFVSWRGVEY